MTDPDERYPDLIRNEQATVIRELRAQLAAARRTEAETKAEGQLDAIRNQVGAWIDDAPPGSAGLDLLRQIITPVPDAVLDLRARWAQLDAANARAASLLAQPETPEQR